MKFSYSYLRKLAPEIKTKKQLVDILNEKVFEVEDVSGDTIDISVPPNRYSDASGHWGVAKEVSAVLGKKFEYPKSKSVFSQSKRASGIVKVEDRKKCPRYIGAVFEDVNVFGSPSEIKKILKSCGIQSINNVVDIMNLVMLETGQPMHAFDLDKVEGKIIVRTARKGETMTTLDDRRVVFAGDELVIADEVGPLAIAGIKGGDRAGVTEKTKRILVEAANFDSLSTYTTSRNVGIITDASLRFSRKLSRSLPEIGVNRAVELLNKYADARFFAWADTNRKGEPKKVVAFDVEKFYKFLGFEIPYNDILKILNNLGFKIVVRKNTSVGSRFLVEVPELRIDINEFVDVAEEVIRVFGFNNTKPEKPKITVGHNDYGVEIEFFDKIKDVLAGAGFNEIYMPSFLPEGYGGVYKNSVELKSSPSERYRYLRPVLEAGFIEAAEENMKHCDKAKMFEIGKVFRADEKGSILEKTNIGVCIASRNKNEEVELEVKGVVIDLFESLGITDWSFPYKNNGYNGLENDVLDINISGNKVGVLKSISIGRGRMGYAELDVDLLFDIEEGEYEYMPIPKYPASERDISFVIDKNQRIGDLIEEISLVDVDLIRDVDLIDEFEGEGVSESGKISVTFRIVFQSNEKTLSDKEVDKLVERIKGTLNKRFGAEERD